MISRNLLAATAFSFLVGAPAVAFAQTEAPAAAQSSAPTVGATVKDPQGGEVGTIATVDDQFVVIRTDRHEARIPLTSLTVTDDAVLIGVTRDELNGQIDQMMAQAAQAFTVGTLVRDRDGVVVGPVEAVDEQMLTVKFGETQFRLPRSAAAPSANGLVIGATVAELRAQLASVETSGTN